MTPRGTDRQAASPASRERDRALLVLVLLQIYLGALVAGLRAGLSTTPGR